MNSRSQRQGRSPGRDGGPSHEVRAEGRDVAAPAGLPAETTRAGMCPALLDGRAWTAKELARHTGVAA